MNGCAIYGGVVITGRKLYIPCIFFRSCLQGVVAVDEANVTFFVSDKDYLSPVPEYLVVPSLTIYFLAAETEIKFTARN